MSRKEIGELLVEDIDTMTDEEAESYLDEAYEANPEVVAAIEETTLIASPGAGPVRILREVLSIP